MRLLPIIHIAWVFVIVWAVRTTPAVDGYRFCVMAALLFLNQCAYLLTVIARESVKAKEIR